MLTARREMLDEYLSISIDKDGRLCTLPSILLNHVPDLDALPTFILRLGTEVNSKYTLIIISQSFQSMHR